MRRAGRVRIAAVHLAAFRVEQSPERPVLRTADSLVLAGWVRSAASAFRNWNFTDRFPAMNPKRGRSRRDPKRKYLPEEADVQERSSSGPRSRLAGEASLWSEWLLSRHRCALHMRPKGPDVRQRTSRCHQRLTPRTG